MSKFFVLQFWPNPSTGALVGAITPAMSSCDDVSVVGDWDGTLFATAGVVVATGARVGLKVSPNIVGLRVVGAEEGPLVGAAVGVLVVRRSVGAAVVVGVI